MDEFVGPEKAGERIEGLFERPGATERVGKIRKEMDEEDKRGVKAERGDLVKIEFEGTVINVVDHGNQYRVTCKVGDHTWWVLVPIQTVTEILTDQR